MSEPRSLTSDLRALQAARKQEETVVSSMITMVETMQRIETEQRGFSQSVNLALGQSREAAQCVAKKARQDFGTRSHCVVVDGENRKVVRVGG